MTANHSAIQEQINSYWNWRGASYDSQPGHGDRIDTAEHTAWVETLTRLLPPPPATLLDVGAGTGFLSFIAAEIGHQVTGIDLAEGMLAVAREQAATVANPPNFQSGDAIAPDFPPQSFEVVMSRHVLWTLRDPEAAFRNWWQLLKPGGRIVAIDSFWFDPEQPQAMDDSDVRTQWNRYYGAETQAVLPNFALNDHAPLVALLRKAGFVDVTVEQLADIRAAEATPIGHTARYALVAHRAG
ncbi:MAG: methyltransferase domain-containing protein [Caldilineaceae bacterium]